MACGSELAGGRDSGDLVTTDHVLVETWCIVRARRDPRQRFFHQSRGWSSEEVP